MFPVGARWTQRALNGNPLSGNVVSGKIRKCALYVRGLAGTARDRFFNQ